MRSGTAFFPDGIIGAGLLLLRFSVASSILLLTASVSQVSYVPQMLGVAAAAALCAGLQTRVVAGLALLAPLVCLVVKPTPVGPIALHALTALALAMTGPGAFSADARLFGRRTITLPDRDDSNV